MLNGSFSHCVESGQWQPSPTLRNLSVLISKSSKYLCAGERQARLGVQRQQWEVDDVAGCALADPLVSTFGGAFERTPVEIAFLGDSVGSQAASALQAAVAHNRHLQPHVRFVHPSASCKLVCNLATIPASAIGCRRLLETIHWPPAERAAGATRRASAASSTSHGGMASSRARRVRRILLAGSGTWYNLKPYCNGTGGSLFGHSDDAPCQHTVMGHHIKPADLKLDHEDPLKAMPAQFWRQYHKRYGCEATEMVTVCGYRLITATLPPHCM